jgi:cell division protein ZapA
MGQSLPVSSDGDDDRLRALAATVDEKIRTIRASGQTVNSVKLVILAALNFADELERLRRDHDELERLRRDHQELVRHLEALNRRLSEAIDGR